MRALILNSISWLLMCVALGSAAQILLKSGLQSHGKISDIGRLISAFQNVRVVIGFALYGFSSLLYITVISRVPVSFAYPFIALTYIGVAILARFFLKETIPPLHVAGLALIFIGVSLVGFAHRHAQQQAPAELVLIERLV